MSDLIFNDAYCFSCSDNIHEFMKDYMSALIYYRSRTGNHVPRQVILVNSELKKYSELQCPTSIEWDTVPDWLRDKLINISLSCNKTYSKIECPMNMEWDTVPDWLRDKWIKIAISYDQPTHVITLEDYGSHLFLTLHGLDDFYVLICEVKSSKITRTDLPDTVLNVWKDGIGFYEQQEISN